MATFKIKVMKGGRCRLRNKHGSTVMVGNLRVREATFKVEIAEPFDMGPIVPVWDEAYIGKDEEEGGG